MIVQRLQWGLRKGGSRGQRGEGRLGCIVWTVLLALAILIAVKTIPVKLASVEFYDFMLEQAKFAAGSGPEQIKGRILGKARDLDIPLSEKRLRVEHFGDRIRMKAQYTIPVEFPFYTYEWQFTHEIDRDVFYF